MDKVRSIIFVLFLLIGNIVLGQRIEPLYVGAIPNSKIEIPINDRPSIEIYLPEKEKAIGTAVIIFPGGAYSFLADKEEGVSIAKTFVERGIAAFVVRYRLPNRESMVDKSLGPLMDAQQAIKTVRSNADKLGVDPKKIGVIGYSAGGHLASTLGTHFIKNYIPNKESINLRPDFMILVYPVVSMNKKLGHLGSRISLLGMEPSKEKVELFSNELHVTNDTPPTYLTHAGDDSLVDVNNSIVFYQALQRNGVVGELHLFPKGNHGFTQRLSVNEWMDPMLFFLKREGFYK